MDSFEANKIIGVTLGTVFLMFGGSLLAEGIFHSEAPETPGFEIVVAESDGGEGGGEAESVAPIAARLQEASVDEGASQFKKCSACHVADSSNANKVGPGLYSVVDRPIATHEGFDYSGALRDFSEGGSVVWDYEHLDAFLENPKGYISGTKMGFAGIRDPQQRADVIAYLREQAASPVPLPEAPAEGAAEGGEEVEAPGATTQAAESTDQLNTQAPGTTDPDTGSAMPGQEQAPVLSEAPQAEAAEDASSGEQPAEASEAPAADAAESEAPAEGGASADEQAAAAPEGEQQVAAAGEAAGGGATVAATEVAGDPAAGEKVFNRCRACHAVGEGATNRIGPELNGIIGEGIAAVEGYNFSQGLKDYAAEHPTWTVEEMTAWLTNPRAVVSNTKMAFPGLNNPEDVQNVIAYLAQFNEDGTISGN